MSQSPVSLFGKILLKKIPLVSLAGQKWYDKAIQNVSDQTISSTTLL